MHGKLLSVAALLGLVFIAAACSSGSASPGVASLGATTTTAAVAQGNTAADYTDAVAYAQCMRAHGVPNFPDPNSKGQFLIKRGQGGGASQSNSADKSCRYLLPNGGVPTPAQKAYDVAQALKFSKCMRSHGLPDFPDPVVKGGNISIRLNAGNVPPNSPILHSAMNICQPILNGVGP